MGAPEFLDSNVLIYAYDPTDTRKQSVARQLLRHAIEAEFSISTQVLAEFAATLRHKLSPAATADDIFAALDTVSPLRLIVPDVGMVRRAVEMQVRYGIHFYDGMIVAAAERAGCGTIWSEDLSPGHTYFGVTVRNPFD